MSATTSDLRTPYKSRAALGAALGFLIAYLAVGFAMGALGDRDLPLPDAPAGEAAAYYAANPSASGVAAGLQVISVICFAVFVRSLTPALSAAESRTASRLRAVGLVSVAAMVVSSLAAVGLIAFASSASLETVDVLRQVGFYTGGVANVATLGAFVFATSLVLGRRGVLGRGSRWFGYFAGALAMLSVLSLAFYYANAFLPVGRVLSMVWTVVVGVVFIRRGARTS